MTDFSETDSGVLSRRLGRYRLCARIASGGMAVVYLARTEGAAGFDKLVAVKCIHEHLASEGDWISMFLDEARIASRITHPNVCQVFDFGEADGTYFLAMEYLPGLPLSRIMKAARANEVQIPIWWAARVVADVAEGLHAAHELRAADGHLLNVVHRDVSPQNVLVTRDGVVKVLDFGVASARDRLQSTTKGQIKGKVAYMAPEQLRGEPVDRTADVWALGVLAWELVAGEALFQRSTGAATYGAVMRAAAPRLRERRPEIPPALDTLIARALDPAPDRRVATAREMARGLLPFALLDGAPVGMPDVAGWTEELLPGAAERQRQDVERALHHAASAPDSGASSLASAAASTGSRLRGRRIARLALIAAGVAAAGGLGIGLAESRLGWMTDSADVVRSARSSSSSRDAGSSTSALVVDAGTLEPSADAGADPEPGATDRTNNGATDNGALNTAAADTKQLRSRQVMTGRGSVNIATPGGWAEVWYRGQRLGTTPIQVTLPAGVQHLELRPFGRRPGRRVQTRVRADRVTRVREALTE